MSLALDQSLTAITPRLTASFLGVGGVTPYAYSVVAGGAGGSINASTGLYQAPSQMGSTPQTLYDTIQVLDAIGRFAYAEILVAEPLFLFCEIIQREMGLANGQVFLWDQKVFQPKDSDLYIAVSVANCKPYANRTVPDPVTGWADAVQSLNLKAILDLDIISRGPSARDRKEEVVIALNSIYAQSQQEINSFSIGRISTDFVNLSLVDGAAIPYRFKISVALLYQMTKTKSIAYFDTFNNPPSVTTNS